MVLALSNALEIPIVVFSSALHHPLLFITPKVLKVACPIFIRFSQYGPGHYSGVCAVDDEIPQRKLSIESKCWCGQKDIGNPLNNIAIVKCPARTATIQLEPDQTW